jgi:hypothetical protein
MTPTASLTQMVETYRFSDVVTLWARERLEHQEIVARALARAVVCDGLRLQSIDDRWATNRDKPIEFRGYPYVGYTAQPSGAMSILRSSALNHLFAVVERAEEPVLEKLREEFIDRNDFRTWLLNAGLTLPRFWYAPEHH